MLLAVSLIAAPPCRFNLMGIPITGMPVTPWPRHCWPMACACSVGPSNTIVRADCWLPVRKNPTPSLNCAPVRDANPILAPPSSNSSRGWKHGAKIVGRRCSSTLAPSMACSRRSLARAFTIRLSCGQPRSGNASTSLSFAALRVSAVPRRKKTRTATKRPGRSATCWWSVAARRACVQRSKQAVVANASSSPTKTFASVGGA